MSLPSLSRSHEGLTPALNSLASALMEKRKTFPHFVEHVDRDPTSESRCCQMSSCFFATATKHEHVSCGWGPRLLFSVTVLCRHFLLLLLIHL